MYLKKLEKREKAIEQLKSISYDSNEYEGLIAQLLKLEQAQERQKETAKKVQEEREVAVSHNSKVEQLIKNREVAEKKLQELQDKDPTSTIETLKLLLEICDRVIVGKQIPKRLEILERFINIELANFTSQYTVKLDMQKDKIKPKVLKKDKIYPIENVSTGEKARINISLIFAIRNILTRLDKQVYNINLLYIDELLGVLDFAGKHLLIDTLKTYDLNIFIVSHDYTFPGIELLNLVKENNKTNVE